MSSLVKTQKQKSEKSELIKYEINRTNVITNESFRSKMKQTNEKFRRNKS